MPLSVSLQYKKHRLSVGHTNNYAKSVVNMADMVRIVLILFLESLPQALPPCSKPSTHCTDFSFNQPHSFHLKPLGQWWVSRFQRIEAVAHSDSTEADISMFDYSWPHLCAVLRKSDLLQGHVCKLIGRWSWRKVTFFCCVLEDDHMKPTLFGNYTLISMYK